jgi:hypothetical protein
LLHELLLLMLFQELLLLLESVFWILTAIRVLKLR